MCAEYQKNMLALTLYGWPENAGLCAWHRCTHTCTCTIDVYQCLQQSRDIWRCIAVKRRQLACSSYGIRKGGRADDRRQNMSLWYSY